MAELSNAPCNRTGLLPSEILYLQINAMGCWIHYALGGYRSGSRDGERGYHIAMRLVVTVPFGTLHVGPSPILAPDECMSSQFIISISLTEMKHHLVWSLPSEWPAPSGVYTWRSVFLLLYMVVSRPSGRTSYLVQKLILVLKQNKTKTDMTLEWIRISAMCSS